MSSGALNETVIMLKDQEPHRNINDLTDEETYYAIHGLEPHSESNEEQGHGGGSAPQSSS